MIMMMAFPIGWKTQFFLNKMSFGKKMGSVVFVSGYTLKKITWREVVIANHDMEENHINLL